MESSGLETGATIGRMFQRLSTITNMKIYDCFTFNNEIDLLKLRLEFLYEHVEKFVIVESNVTFSGKPKQFHLLENWAQFSKWANKIKYLQYQPSIAGMNFAKPEQCDFGHAAWQIESGQRNHLYEPLKNLNDDCMIIVSDVDEIWNPQTLKSVRLDLAMPAIRLEMEFYYFYVNCRGIGTGNAVWRHPIAVLPSFMKMHPGLGFHQIRNNSRLMAAGNAGWHFSYLGGASAVIDKIESFSHQELNNDKIKDIKRIENCIKLGLDPFDRHDCAWAFVHIDQFPSVLTSIVKQYPAFIKESLVQ
jgi:beta-1,4-mannosyl-glycoprotein beta-1,4-N-acetylglucosaminyltransferase